MTRRFVLLFMALFLGLTPVGAGYAVEPDEMLADPELEARAREISKDLRCVVCQNENIDESNAELARDLRLLVRERLKEGDTDEEVVQYVVDRYGDYVLLKPPFKAKTYALWFGPPVFLLIALYAGWRFYRSRAVPVGGVGEGDDVRPPPLSPEEKRRLEKLLRDEESPGGTA